MFIVFAHIILSIAFDGEWTESNIEWVLDIMRARESDFQRKIDLVDYMLESPWRFTDTYYYKRYGAALRNIDTGEKAHVMVSPAILAGHYRIEVVIEDRIGRIEKSFDKIV